MARAGRQARAALLSDTQTTAVVRRAGQAVGPPVEHRREARRGPEGPAVGGEDAHRHARQRGGDAAQDPGLGAVGVQHDGPLAAQQRDQLEQAERVSRPQRAAQVTQRDVARTAAADSIAQRALAVGGDDDVEALGQRRDERGHVGLRPADARQRHQQQDRGRRQRASTRAPSVRSDASRPNRARAAASATGSPSSPSTIARRQRSRLARRQHDAKPVVGHEPPCQVIAGAEDDDRAPAPTYSKSFMGRALRSVS